MEKIDLHCGDCLEQLKKLPDCSIDLVLTDPPYGLRFMGKSWDYEVPSVELWAECLRVLKPGGHLLSFSGTRTYHRMAVAIEDAGFEVRDMIEWIYSTGFPKSLNIGKAVDKLQGNERDVVGESNTINQKKSISFKATKQHIEYGNKIPLTKGTSEWEGWGTALKPAHEPICMARKPLSERTVAENCLKWGTGGINIDESRVESNEELGRNNNARTEGTSYVVQKETMRIDNSNGKRFPANLIHDNSEEVTNCFPERKTGSKLPHHKQTESENNSMSGKNYARTGQMFLGDEGNASRFFKSIPNKVVDLQVFSMYNKGILIKIKEKLCGQRLTKKKTGIMLAGVIQEAEKFIQDAELLMSGNSTMEKFLMDIVSTTKTLTQQMTELKTLNVLPNWLITKFTEESEKTINLLKELNTEDVKSVKSIFLLQTFISEVLESIRAIAESVVEQDLNNGEKVSDNSRFFKSIIYQAKASKSDRGEGNNHPTVKPTALMEYLIKMVSRAGQTVLDPYMGSGSTGMACQNTGRSFVGIEKEEQYFRIAQKRINGNL